MSASLSFDQVAAQYDDLWTSTPHGIAQRQQVWRAIDGLFQRGEHVLDIGCGTGVDAAHLRDLGLDVHATDASWEMVRAARHRGGFRVSMMRAEDIGTLEDTYDGAISDFGAINCVADLTAFAEGLAKVVRPGGRVAICTIGRFCLWEFLHYALRLKFTKAMRRWRGSASSTLAEKVYYPTVAQLAAAFEAFELQSWTGIGLLAPPSYVGLSEATISRCASLDRSLAHLPLLRAMADHRLLILVRK